MTDSIKTSFAVIGSGPGGSITAACLAEAGYQVLLVEEGANLALDSAPHFSLEEISQKYRNGGITVGMGKTKVAYVEGRVVGGGSEINRGMYHRIHGETLEQWKRDYKVESLSLDLLNSNYKTCENISKVSDLPVAPPDYSIKLHEGAVSLGWKSRQVPRLVLYQKDSQGRVTGRKESMTTTWIPRFIAAGGRIMPDTRIKKIRQHGNKWYLDGVKQVNGHQPVKIVANGLFIACGAIHTPALLRRSGFKKNIGNSLKFHPMLKVVAQFKDEINQADGIDPVHQVVEFDPRFSMGVSMSLKPLLSLTMLDHPDYLAEVDKNWKHMGIYYVQSTKGIAIVQNVPGYTDPLIRINMGPAELADIEEGLIKLCEVLFAAGATVIYPGIVGSPVFRSPNDFKKINLSLLLGRANLSTLHLFSSCPMGENPKKCAADSYGKVHGVDRLYINDASLLCGPTVINPQATVMAIAHRNIQEFLNKRANK